MECKLQTFFPFSRKNATLTTNAHEGVSQWLVFLFALVLFLTLSLLVCLPSSFSSPAARRHLPPLSLYSLRTKSASLTEKMAEFLEFCCAWICFHFQVTTFVVVCSSFFPHPPHSILGVVLVLLLMRISQFFAEFILREFQGQQTPLPQQLLVLFRTLPNHRLVINNINGQQLPNLRASPFKLDPCGKQIRLPGVHNCPADVLFPLC